MPLLDVEPLLTDSLACERAHMLLSFMTNCYVRGKMNDTPLEVLTPQILLLIFVENTKGTG